MLLQSTHSCHPFSSTKNHILGPVHVLSTVITHGQFNAIQIVPIFVLFPTYKPVLRFFNYFSIFPSYVINKSVQKYTIKENHNETLQNNNNNINNKNGKLPITNKTRNCVKKINIPLKSRSQMKRGRNFQCNTKKIWRLQDQLKLFSAYRTEIAFWCLLQNNEFGIINRTD